MLQEDTILWRHGVLAERKAKRQGEDAIVGCLQKARTKQGSVRGWLYCGVLAVAVLLQRWRRRHRCPPVSQWGPGSTRHPLSSSNLFQNVSPNDCSFNSSTGHSLQQDLRFFQVIKFNVILKHSISNSKFRTGHEFLFNVVLPIHSSCHSNLSKASMEWTKHRWLIVNLNLVSHRKQSASTETVTSWRKRELETWRRWALIQNEYLLLHYCLRR